MFKSKKSLVVVSVLCLVVAGALLALGLKTKASITHKSYEMPTYSYDVELDAAYDSESGKNVENGIQVWVSPDRPSKDAAGFSTAYLQASHERAQQWEAERRAGLADVMIIFSHPLSLEEANAVLNLVKADVFESGFVGYVDDVPFAGYLKEEGRLTRTLQECAELGARSVGPEGVEPEITEDSDNAARDATYDMRGYLAVRAWVDSKNLDVLLNHKDVLVVDTTPQDIRDQLSEDPIWKDKIIRVIALEMPVWAYEWK